MLNTSIGSLALVVGSVVAMFPGIGFGETEREVAIDQAMAEARGEIDPDSLRAITGLAVTQVDFSRGYPSEDGTIFATGADEVAATWETFREAWTVYRLWATVDSPVSTVGGIGGSVDNRFSLILTGGEGCAFFNAPTFGADTPQNPTLALVEPEIAFDTWVTVGTALPGPGPLITDPDNAFNGFSGGINCQNCGWTTTPAAGLGVVEYEPLSLGVLLGQFTVPREHNFLVQAAVAGGGQIIFESWLYVSSTSCETPCPWDCSPPYDVEFNLPAGNSSVNIDDLLLIINGVATQDLDCDVAPDHGNGAFGDFDVDIDDILAVIDNFGSCP